MNYLIQRPRLSKTPSELIYEFPNIASKKRSSQRLFSMVSLENCERAGFLVCHKSNLNLRDDYNGNSHAIDFICTPKNNHRYGTRLLNFAKNLSKQIGCNGYVFLKSDISFTPNRIPHLFYRKNGFSTLNQKTDEKLDAFIKTGKNATLRDFSSMNMFFPAPQEPPKDTLFSKAMNNFNRIVKNILK